MSINNNQINVEGYQIFRSDRNSHAGGVAVYAKKNLRCKRICSQPGNSEIEYLFIEIVGLNDKKLLLGCVYRPKSNVALKPLLDQIELLHLRYENIVLVGDFNSNILAENILTDPMYGFGLKPVNINQPTHFTSHSQTLLDVFFVENVHKALFFDQASAPAFSKHDLIFLTYDFRKNPLDFSFNFRDFKNVDTEELLLTFDDLNWDDIYLFKNSGWKS